MWLENSSVVQMNHSTAHTCSAACSSQPNLQLPWRFVFFLARARSSHSHPQQTLPAAAAHGWRKLVVFVDEEHAISNYQCGILA